MGEIVPIRARGGRVQVPVKLVSHTPQGGERRKVFPSGLLDGTLEARLLIAHHADALAAQVARLIAIHGDLRPEVRNAGIVAVKALDAFKATLNGDDKPEGDAA